MYIYQLESPLDIWIGIKDIEESYDELDKNQRREFIENIGEAIAELKNNINEEIDITKIGYLAIIEKEGYGFGIAFIIKIENNGETYIIARKEIENLKEIKK